MSDIFKLPVTMTKYESKRNRSMRIILDSQENLADNQLSRIAQYHEKFLWLVLLHEDAKYDEYMEDIKNLPELKREKFEKSPSQRLRDVLYIYYMQNHKDSTGFDSWRITQMENIINTFKERLI